MKAVSSTPSITFALIRGDHKSLKNELNMSMPLSEIFDSSYSFYDENQFMRVSTVNYDVNMAKYQPYSLKLVKNFGKNFRSFFVDSAYLRVDRRTGNKKLETFLFADLGDRICRICQWPNRIVPVGFKFVKNHYKSYSLYVKIPRGFVGIKYTSGKAKSVYLIPKRITIDGDFSRDLGLFGSDGNKTRCLGISNTDLFLVKQLREFYRKLNVTEKRLKIIRHEPEEKWKEQFCFQFENRILRVFLENLHKIFLEKAMANFDDLKHLTITYVQGFHSGDGYCGNDTIGFASHKNDPALDFIIKVVEKLGGHLSHEEIKGKCRMVSFSGLSNLLIFYHHSMVQHPAKARKLKESLKNFQIYVQLEKAFLRELGIRDTCKILKCHERTAYRYLGGWSGLPLSKVIGICKYLQIRPTELKNQVRFVKTSRENLNEGLAKEAYLTALSLEGEA